MTSTRHRHRCALSHLSVNDVTHVFYAAREQLQLLFRAGRFPARAKPRQALELLDLAAAFVLRPGNRLRARGRAADRRLCSGATRTRPAARRPRDDSRLSSTHAVHRHRAARALPRVDGERAAVRERGLQRRHRRHAVVVRLVAAVRERPRHARRQPAQHFAQYRAAKIIP